MDNTGPSPPKRPRAIDFLTSQLGKPVRYFPFNRKSSGNTQQEKLVRMEQIPAMKSQHAVTSSLPVTPFSSTMKFVPNKEANISNKLQKLKLKSPDGRDLGEINVQLLPQKGDGIGGKTIMLQKHSLFGKIDNSSAVSILKPLEKNKQTTTTFSGTISVHQSNTTHSSLVNNGSNCVSMNTIRTINTMREIGNSRPILSLKQKVETHHSPLILRHSEISQYSPASLGSKVFVVNVDKQTGLNTVKTVNNERHLASNQKIVVVHAENYPDSTEGKKKNGLSTPSELRTNLSGNDDTSTELASSTSNARTIPNVFWNPSKFSDLPSKLASQKNRTNDNEASKSGNKPTKIGTQSLDSERVKSVGKSITLGTSTLHKKRKPRLNSWTIVKTSSQKLENSIQNNCEVDSKETPKKNVDISRISQAQNPTVNNISSENSQNVTSTTNNILDTVNSKQCNGNVDVNTQNDVTDERSSGDKNLRENIMVILHGDMKTLQSNEKKSSDERESSNKTISMEVEANTEIDANLTHAVNAEIVSRDISPAKPDDNAKQNVFSKEQDLDIIKKALSSCTDQELRDKALKALADCGIGVKRDVPVSPMVSVCNSTTQTTVFSLLKPDTLLEYSNDSPILNKLNVVNSADKSPWDPCEVLPFNDTTCLDLSDSLFPDYITSDLDNYLSEASRKDVNQVKDIFFKPSPIISQTYAQIQKDFEAATTVDANGMMGIHRAVLSGNIKEVRRQLIVLKAVKESIEVPTGNGKTSLELAVLHDVDPQIVQALLAAGAKPAFPIKLHESALVIASRTSSVVLPELIKHITPPSLLDIMDSEGFAPLHYCAQLGNLQGVKALVAAGALVNLKDAKSGRTALFHALESRNIDMAWHLVENGASPNIVNFAGQSPAALVDEYRHNSLAEKFNQAVR